MTGFVGQAGSRSFQVIIGVDTHQDEHVAVAIDRQGIRLGELHALATVCGYRELELWSRSLGEVSAFGIEGTGSYGAGVARFMAGRGYTVVEVNRPDRSTRYRKGKSDPTDAEMAARAVLSGVADATPKSGDGEVEMIRVHNIQWPVYRLSRALAAFGDYHFLYVNAERPITWYAVFHIRRSGTLPRW